MGICYHKVMITKCEICKKEYYIRPSHYKRVKRHFCSSKCKGIGQTDRQNPAWKDSWEKKCLNCEKIFRHKDRGGLKFCSRKCNFEFSRIKNTRNCLICNKIFIKKGGDKGKFCSLKCAGVIHSLQMEGVNNPNWLEGIGNLPYKWDFNNKLKIKIRKRDDFICRLCGLKESDLIIKKGCGLAIHHIDYDKENTKENNLISLCNKCHGYTHYNRKKWKQELSKMLEK